MKGELGQMFLSLLSFVLRPTFRLLPGTTDVGAVRWPAALVAFWLSRLWSLGSTVYLSSFLQLERAKVQ